MGGASGVSAGTPAGTHEEQKGTADITKGTRQTCTHIYVVGTDIIRCTTRACMHCSVLDFFKLNVDQR